ncbi:MAG TPA: DUF4465 domain-containing protein [Candidatus Tidjanibacter gallistercoris]|nr:DUF4465 domain-containing protein [Candidatus Tidjanibacter gallistercoris]
MKRIFVFVLALAAVLSLAGCKRTTEGGSTEPLNFKKLTNGKAVYLGEEDGLRHYAVTLWTNDRSTAAADNYKEADISLELELVTAATGSEEEIASGTYALSASAQAGVLLASSRSALSVITPYSYGGDKRELAEGEVTVSSFNGNYEIKGLVTDRSERILDFTYYGALAFEGTGPVEPETTVITFEAAELSASTGTYSDILWGREQAEEADGSQVYNGLLYTEGAASFGSYYSFDGEWESWGGFALSANRDLEDLGMDYSNQFSVYAPDNTQFAVGYAFGDWGGAYGVPIIEFSEPVRPVSADAANANKTYHYCVAHPLVGEEGSEEDIRVDLVAVGYNGGTETGRASLRLAQGAEVLDTWTDFDLSGLGEVTQVVFSIESNDTGEYGLNVPAFFCIDNIEIR